MKQESKVGDHVGWNSEAGRVREEDQEKSHLRTTKETL
jgi:hypothetical protein